MVNSSYKNFDSSAVSAKRAFDQSCSDVLAKNCVSSLPSCSNWIQACIGKLKICGEDLVCTKLSSARSSFLQPIENHFVHTEVNKPYVLMGYWWSQYSKINIFEFGLTNHLNNFNPCETPTSGGLNRLQPFEVNTNLVITVEEAEAIDCFVIFFLRLSQTLLTMEKTARISIDHFTQIETVEKKFLQINQKLEKSYQLQVEQFFHDVNALRGICADLAKPKSANK